jgi:hypothetical protein
MKSIAKILLFCSFLFAANAFADSINFEGRVDQTLIDATYTPQGVIFQNAEIVTAGLSLDASQFPPDSGIQAVMDVRGPIEMMFATPVTDFSAFFTYTQPLTVLGYDSLKNLVASSISIFDENFASSGNSPNELISLHADAGIQFVLITGSATGNSFIMDDMSFGNGQVVNMEEPHSSTLLLPCSLLLLACFYKKRRVFLL